MRYTLFIFFLSFVFISCNNISTSEVAELEVVDEFKDGDLIFQTSLSSQSGAIQIATDSKYSHVGILFQRKEAWYVLEAIQVVSITPLDEWIDRGKDDRYVIKRLKNNDLLSNEVLGNMQAEGQNMLGKPYDLLFEWSDEKIYCSELVWKIYKEGADVELCALKTFKDYNLEDEKVKAKIAERFGKTFPLNELVVSPDDLFQSGLLTEVK